MELYEWLDDHLPLFFNNLGLNQEDCNSVITAHGDKCEGYKNVFEKNGLNYYHGVSIYLLLSFFPYCSKVRNTVDGWVDPFKWIIDNKDSFIKYLPEIT